MKVTPWEVSGKVDYDKLTKQFGVKPLDEKLHKRLVKLTGEDHYLLRRHVFFSHMYFDEILTALEKGEKVYMYTGRAPSGPVHLGHMVPWILVQWLQQRLKLNLIFQVPDEEKPIFKDNFSWDDADRILEDNLKDIIAVGLDPKLTKIVIDTKHADLMYRTACQVAAKTTASTAKALFGLKDSDNVGKYFYSCMQSVPAFLPTILEGKKTRVFIPCAIDQDVHFRLTRDVAPKLGFPKPSTLLCRFLPSLEGEGKMSSSASSIPMTATSKEVRKTIMKYAFSGGKDTVEEHRKHGGNADIDMSYQWLTFFESDDEKLADIKRRYESGEMLSGEIKQALVDTLVRFMAAHQERRKHVDIDRFLIRTP